MEFKILKDGNTNIGWTGLKGGRRPFYTNGYVLLMGGIENGTVETKPGNEYIDSVRYEIGESNGKKYNIEWTGEQPTINGEVREMTHMSIKNVFSKELNKSIELLWIPTLYKSVKKSLGRAPRMQFEQKSNKLSIIFNNGYDFAHNYEIDFNGMPNGLVLNFNPEYIGYCYEFLDKKEKIGFVSVDGVNHDVYRVILLSSGGNKNNRAFCMVPEKTETDQFDIFENSDKVVLIMPMVVIDLGYIEPKKLVLEKPMEKKTKKLF